MKGGQDDSQQFEGGPSQDDVVRGCGVYYKISHFDGCGAHP